MGMDLYRLKDGAYFCVQIYRWPSILELAKLNGWEPAGTILDDYEHSRMGVDPDVSKKIIDEWSGGYDSNDWQVITEADAKALAAGIERALPDIPDRRPLNDDLWMFQELAGQQEHLKELIDFLRAGGCRIG